MKKNIRNLSFAILAAVILEFAVFNFSNLRMLMDNSLQKNESFALQDFQQINWTSNGGGSDLVSQKDPMLILENISMDIRNMELVIDTEGSVPYIDIFYTDEEHQYFGEETLIKVNGDTSGPVSVAVDRLIQDIRIDLGDEEGTVLRSFKLVINPARLDISMSRIIAVILIYISSIALFSLQKRPTYEIDAENAEKR